MTTGSAPPPSVESEIFDRVPLGTPLQYQI